MTPGGAGPGRRSTSAWRVLWRTTVRGRCPRCGEGALFARTFELVRACPRCGVVLQPGEGSHYGGPMVIGYSLGVGAALLVGAALVWRFGADAWVEWTAVAASIPAALLGYRFGKSFWTWLLWRTGQIDPEAGPPGVDHS